jgi:hypothetical protein
METYSMSFCFIQLIVAPSGSVGMDSRSAPSKAPPH